MAQYNFYKTQRWKRLRQYIIDRAGGLCEECGGICGEPATIAHHKVWINDNNINDPAIVWGTENLMAVSQTCHNRIHHGQAEPCIKGLTFDSTGMLIEIDHFHIIKISKDTLTR